MTCWHLAHTFNFEKKTKQGLITSTTNCFHLYIVLLSPWNLMHNKTTGLVDKASVRYDSTSWTFSSAARRTHFMGWDFSMECLGDCPWICHSIHLQFFIATFSLYLSLHYTSAVPYCDAETHRHLLMGAPFLFLWDISIRFQYSFTYEDAEVQRSWIQHKKHEANAVALWQAGYRVAVLTFHLPSCLLPDARKLQNLWKSYLLAVSFIDVNK